MRPACGAAGAPAAAGCQRPPLRSDGGTRGWWRDHRAGGVGGRRALRRSTRKTRQAGDAADRPAKLPPVGSCRAASPAAAAYERGHCRRGTACRRGLEASAEHTSLRPTHRVRNGSRGRVERVARSNSLFQIRGPINSSAREEIGVHLLIKLCQQLNVKSCSRGFVLQCVPHLSLPADDP